MQDSDSQMIPLQTFNDSSIVFHSDESIAYAHKKINQINKEFSDIIRKTNTNRSRIQAPPKRQALKIRRDTLKDVSKGALYLLKQKSILLSHIFENEEKKQDLIKTIGKRDKS